MSKEKWLDRWPKHSYLDAFVSHHGGKVISIDIDSNAIGNAKRFVGHNVSFYEMDSIYFLNNFRPEKDVDLLYIDSYDINDRHPYPSAAHHLGELAAGIRWLRKGALVAVDDAISENIGKHMYIQMFFEHIGIKPFLRVTK